MRPVWSGLPTTDVCWLITRLSYEQTHWNTVTLGGDVPDDALRFM